MEAHLLSLPFALAPAAILIVLAYAAVMRGAPTLRLWLFVHCACLMPYSVVMTLSPSITSPAVAERAFQIAAAFIPMAAASGTGIQLALTRRYRRWRWLVWAGVASAAIWVVGSSISSIAVDGVHRLPGLWYAAAGRWAWLALLHTALLALPGFLGLATAALGSAPSSERRQLRLVLAANAITYAGLVDVGMAYGIGVFPLGWLLSGVGTLLVVRALVVEDLLRVRAVDATAPLLVVHLATALMLAWSVLTLLGPSPWWVTALGLGLCFAGTRATIATTGMVMTRRARGDEGPLDRLLAQLVTRTRTTSSATEIAQLTADVTELAIGQRPTLVFREALTAEPHLVAWLAGHRGVVFADDLEGLPPALHAPLAALFAAHAAHAVAAAGSGDELLALLVIPRGGRRLRGRPLEFVERAADRLADALLHARMARRAAERARLAREVELAATVQGELLPGKGPHLHGELTVVGSWQPATRCAGDFWAVYPLGEGRVLVAIGDVTGHGVASAMVTAAAVGACEVAVRRGGAALQLAELATAIDVAVRRVGGGTLAMTCFAAILDPGAREVRFVSCGHTAPYLVRRTEKSVELAALVGRGNPLGLPGPGSPPKVQHKSLQAGDLVVWYTDGVVEAQDPAGAPFGDRRLQQLLRKLDRQRLTPAAVHEVVLADVTAHRAGHPLGDDETVVVAQLAGGAAP